MSISPPSLHLIITEDLPDLKATHQEMNAVTAAEIGNLMLCCESNGEIYGVWLLKGDAQVTDLFRDTFQWRRVEIEADAIGNIAHEISFKAGSDEALIHYFDR